MLCFNTSWVSFFLFPHFLGNPKYFFTHLFMKFFLLLISVFFKASIFFFFFLWGGGGGGISFNIVKENIHSIIYP